MHQPHHRPAFDQTCPLIGDDRWGLDHARVGQRTPMFLPGLGLALGYQRALQHGQRPRRNREQYRLSQRANLIAEPKDDLRA
jgi:hypothetical protein